MGVEKTNTINSLKKDFITIVVCLLLSMLPKG